MRTVTFAKAFTIEVDASTTLTYPEGWTGPVDDDVAVAAAEAGCIPTGGPEPAPVKTKGGSKAAASEPDAETAPV